MDYKYEECFIHYSGKNISPTIRCPECENHGEQINTRGDCKNLITKKDGTIMQCQCCSEEHKTGEY